MIASTKTHLLRLPPAWQPCHSKTVASSSYHRSAWPLQSRKDSALVSLSGHTCHTLQPEGKYWVDIQLLHRRHRNLQFKTALRFFLTWQKSMVYLDLQSSEQNSSVEPPYCAVTSFWDVDWQKTQDWQCFPQVLVSSCWKRSLQPDRKKGRVVGKHSNACGFYKGLTSTLIAYATFWWHMIVFVTSQTEKHFRVSLPSLQKKQSLPFILLASRAIFFALQCSHMDVTYLVLLNSWEQSTLHTNTILSCTHTAFKTKWIKMTQKCHFVRLAFLKPCCCCIPLFWKQWQRSKWPRATLNQWCVYSMAHSSVLILKFSVTKQSIFVTEPILETKETGVNITSMWMSSGFAVMQRLHWAQLISLVLLDSLRWGSVDVTSWLWVDPMGNLVKTLPCVWFFLNFSCSNKTTKQDM